jgi:non-specific serine/threonine protein kinase/serine/threonine-protein kinase
VPGTTAARKLIVTRAIEYLDSLSQQEASDIDLARELARAYVRIGNILGDPYQPNLGDSTGALTSYRRALALYDRLEPRDRRADTRAGMAEAYVGLGSLAWSNGDAGGARSNYSRALAIYDEIGRGNSPYHRNLAAAAYFLAQTEFRYGDAALAKVSYERAEREFEALLAANPGDSAMQRSLSAAYTKLGDVDSLTGDLDGALREYRRAEQTLTSLLSQTPSSTDVQRRAAQVWLRLAGMDPVVSARDREAFARRASRVQLALAEADPSNTQAVTDFAETQWVLAKALLDQGRDREAAEACATSVQTFDKVLSATPGLQDARRGLGSARQVLGELAMRRRDAGAALDHYERARVLLESPDIAHDNGDLLAALYGDIGDAHAALSRGRCVSGDTNGNPDTWYRRSQSAWTALTQRRPLDTTELRLLQDVERKLKRNAGDSDDAAAPCHP